MNQLITNIELLSNQKSFSLGISNTAENLWFLMHFKKLEILNTVIYRQQYNEFRTTKTKYPSRRLMKKFANTADFLDYLSPISGPTKRIFLYEIAFTNGWKIKEHCYTHFTIYTNSLEERNTLINYLINSVGYDPITIDLMEPNITYYFKASGSLEDYKFDVTPDEFWSEERLQQWKEAYIKKNYKEEELEKGEPFIDTNNIFTDFPSIKLKGWTEGDPF
jgi:hypothetical protein